MNKIIKSVLLALAVVFTTNSAVAQDPMAILIGNSDGKVEKITYNPKTTIKVSVTVRRDVIQKGPYARFAQKYLGVIPALTDKDIYTLQSAYVEYALPGAVFMLQPQVELQQGVAEMSHLRSDSTFTKVSPDKMEIGEKSLEIMAQSAATTIFSIRKNRMQLITGEAGENVFGAGLKAALDELNRIEQEYLSLFLGKQTVQYIKKEYEVIPEKGSANYVFCRFSENGGLLPSTDLSGRPVILDLKSENAEPKPNITLAVKPVKTDIYRMPDFMRCRVIEGKKELTSVRIPFYQSGANIEIPTR